MSDHFDPVFHSASDSVDFWLEIDGKRVQARISGEALLDHYGALSLDREPLLDAFRANSGAIAEKAFKAHRVGVHPLLLKTQMF